MFVLLSLLGVIAGLGLLVFGANQLVDGTAGFAKKVGISPQIIGVTLVAVATSLPELFTSVTATITGNDGIGIGNVVGSNTFNIGIVLAVSLLILNIKPSKMAIVDGYVMNISALLLGVFLMDLYLKRWEAVILLVGYAGYVYYLVMKSRESFVYETPWVEKSMTFLVVLIIIGTVCLIAGAPILVTCASDLARIFGIDQTIIGSTLVAAGTSFPELFTSIIASIKKEGDIALGNVVGSNIFNILIILGISGIIRPLESNTLLSVSLVPGMILLTLIATLISANKMGKKEGLLLLIGYIAWSALLFE